MHRLFAPSLLFLLVVSHVLAQGSNVGTATALGINSNASGTMSDNSVDHYWKISTTANGYLRIQINSGSSIDVDATLFDINGTTTILSDGRSGTYSEVYGFLKPGTYYVKAHRWSGTTGTYTITTTFLSPSRSGDAESNDSPSTAVALSPTGISTGHLGFYSGGATDADDYWKIATTQDGWLRVQVRSDSLDLRGVDVFDLDITLFDVNGTTTILSDGRGGAFSQVGAFLRPGTYYIKIHKWMGGGGGYEIKSEFFTPPLANDAEGNDSYQTASTATVNGSVTGHLGYYSDGTTDFDDYWKFTTSSDGKLIVQAVSDSTDRSGSVFDLDIAIYDINGTSTIISDGRSGKSSECIVHLRPGTFFVKVHRWTGNGGSYTLTIIHKAPPLANEGEGNDSYTSATALAFGVSSQGHIGYFANGSTDVDDYWKVVAPSSDSLYVHVITDSTIDVDMTAYGPNGTTSLATDGRYGTYSRVGILAASGSTYYFKVHQWSGTAGSYSILATRSSVVTAIEGETTTERVPAEFALVQNYPNPFNPTTTITFTVGAHGYTSLKVFDMLGREVAVLVNEERAPGVYKVMWDASALPSGIYLYRMRAGDFEETRKMTLMK